MKILMISLCHYVKKMHKHGQKQFRLSLPYSKFTQCVYPRSVPFYKLANTSNIFMRNRRIKVCREVRVTSPYMKLVIDRSVAYELSNTVVLLTTQQRHTEALLYR